MLFAFAAARNYIRGLFFDSGKCIALGGIEFQCRIKTFLAAKGIDQLEVGYPLVDENIVFFVDNQRHFNNKEVVKTVVTDAYGLYDTSRCLLTAELDAFGRIAGNIGRFGVLFDISNVRIELEQV